VLGVSIQNMPDMWLITGRWGVISAEKKAYFDIMRDS